MSFWDRLGLGLAKVAKGAAAGALWASQHPEVINAVAAAAGKPALGAEINAGAAVVAEILPKGDQ